MKKTLTLFAILGAIIAPLLLTSSTRGSNPPAAFGVTIPALQSVARFDADAATLEVYVDSVLVVHENLTGATVHGVLEANDGDELTIRPLSSWIGDGVEVLVSMTIDDVTCAVELTGADCD